MLEVTVKLSVVLVFGPQSSTKMVRSATATRVLQMPTVPRKGETLVIEYRITHEDGDVVRGQITPTVRDVSYVFPALRHGKQTDILLDCGTPYPCNELVMFEKAIEIWRAAKFDVTITEEEDDF